MTVNRNKEILLNLGLVSEGSIYKYSDKVRDREDVCALRDKDSGIIFLDRSDHLDISHYTDIDTGVYWGGSSREEALQKYAEDDHRRFNQFKKYFKNKNILDIGSGTGGFMDFLSETASSVAGVEPQNEIRQELIKAGHKMYKLTEDIPNNTFDVITMFHTLEHLMEPLEVLSDAKKALKPGGLIIIEVPHAKDSLLDLESFRKFTLWSEHMILHTQKSLRVFLEKSGFADISTFGRQRYSAANHLGWISCGKPGGQSIYPELVSNEVEFAYNKILENNDRTDTIFALATA